MQDRLKHVAIFFAAFLCGCCVRYWVGQSLFPLLQAQPRPPIIVPAYVTPPPFNNCLAGGYLFRDPLPVRGGAVYDHCVDPKDVGGAKFTGVACSPPGTNAEAIPYAQLPDGSCLPIIVVPPPGKLASIVTVKSGEVAMVGEAPYRVMYIFSTITPVKR